MPDQNSRQFQENPFDYFNQNTRRVLEEATSIVNMLEGGVEGLNNSLEDYLSQFAIYERENDYILIDTKERNLQKVYSELEGLEADIREYIQDKGSNDMETDRTRTSNEIEWRTEEGELVIRMKNFPIY